MPYQDFYDLDVWKRAREFKLKVYQLVERLPAQEKYGLSDQLLRAVRSIPANIAEGHGRHTHKDEYHFCTMARGSLSEVLNHLVDAFDNGYINKEELTHLKLEWDEMRKLLNGYMSFLKSQSITGNKVNDEAGSYNHASGTSLYDSEVAEPESDLFGNH